MTCLFYLVALVVVVGVWCVGLELFVKALESWSARRRKGWAECQLDETWIDDEPTTPDGPAPWACAVAPEHDYWICYNGSSYKCRGCGFVRPE